MSSVIRFLFTSIAGVPVEAEVGVSGVQSLFSALCGCLFGDQKRNSQSQAGNTESIKGTKGRSFVPLPGLSLP